MDTMTDQDMDTMILNDALKHYDTEQIEITDELWMLEDGQLVRYVKVFTESEDGDVIDLVLDEDESYYVTVVDGIVYVNVERDALRFEYAS